MTSSNTFQSDIGSLQNGDHGKDIITWNYLSIFRFSAFFFFFFFHRPTNPLSRERGRWETKHFMEMALQMNRYSCNKLWIERFREISSPAEKYFFFPNAMHTRLYLNSLLILRTIYSVTRLSVATRQTFLQVINQGARICLTDTPPCKVEHDQMKTCHIVFINKSYNITRGLFSVKRFVGWLR